MKVKRIFFRKTAITIASILGLGLTQGFGSMAHAADATEQVPPSAVDITVHKLMYDSGTKLDVDIDGIKNDGHTHDTLPEGVSKYNKSDYGDIEFTIVNITDIVLPKQDSELTNAKIDQIVEDIESKGANSDYIKNGKNSATKAVDENGEITFSGLPGYTNNNQNVYAIYESKSAAGFIVEKAKPMVVAAPMTSSDGKSFLKNIQLYPKNITKKLNFEFTKYGNDGTEKNEDTPLKDAKFEIYKGEPGKGKNLGAAITDDKGKILVEDLTVGKYYLVEVPSSVVVGKDKNPTQDQYLLGADARNDEHNKLSFEITAEGTNVKLEGSYVNYKAPVIEKTVVGDSFTVGDLVNYQGKILVPQDIEGAEGISINGNKITTSHYPTFNWSDTADKGLTYVASKANLKATNSDKSITLKEGTDFKLTNRENGFTVDFIMDNGKVSETVGKLHGQQIILDYNMVLNETAVVNDPLTNSVLFTYNNNPNSEEEKREITTEVDVKTFGAKFLKVDSGLFGVGGTTPLEGAEFVVLKEGKFFGGQIDTDKDGVKEAQWTDSESDAFVYKSDKDGKFDVQGFSKGEYTLREIKAPEGYQKLPKDIEFTIDENSFDEENRISIKNKQKAAIAHTGSKRNLIIAAAGSTVLLIGLAGAYYMKKRQIN
ncbi:SpaA isopeptide-forming pilin-related protein [Enterococcus sp. AZ196]|uniref:SpaA isopeptide-forming pilin-related protein n=1 Tax=Enterococcus sp. AZ196 TaxID=2774659 RepID=UPI003D26EEE9